MSRRSVVQSNDAEEPTDSLVLAGPQLDGQSPVHSALLDESVDPFPSARLLAQLSELYQCFVGLAQLVVILAAGDVSVV